MHLGSPPAHHRLHCTSALLVSSLAAVDPRTKLQDRQESSFRAFLHLKATMMNNSDPQSSPSSPLVTPNARLGGSRLLTLDGPNTDINTKAWRSLQPEGVQLQFPALIHSGDSSLHLAQRQERPKRTKAWKSLHATVQFKICGRPSRL